MKQMNVTNTEVSNGLTLTLLALSTLTIMVGAAIAPSLPQISAHLRMNNYTSLLITLPSLGVVLAAPLVSMLLTKFGAKVSVLYGLILYGALGVTGAFITNTSLMMLNRFLLGCMTAIVMASGTALIAKFYQGESRLRMIAKQGMAIELGGVIFLSIGGGLALLNWKSPFGLYLIAWLIFIAVWFYVPNTNCNIEDSDENTLNQTNTLIDIYVIAISSMLVFFVAYVNLPHFLQRQGYSELQTGLYLAFISLVAVIFAGVMPRIRRQHKSKTIFIIAFSSYAIAHTILAYWIGTPGLCMAAIFLGIGFGFTIPLANYELIERSHSNKRNRNLAYLSSAIFLGQFLSSAFDMFSQSKTSVFQFAAAISIISCVALLLLDKHRNLALTLKI